MRVALYARVSSEDQVRHGLSIEAQLAALDEWAKDKTVVDHYVDLGISARKPASKRPELQRLLQDVEAGKIDLIAFVKLDRWFRNVKEYYKVDEILERHHVAWKAINEDYETETASGRFKVNIMLAVAQDEADRTSERIKAVFAMKREKGEVLCGSAPLGTAIVDKRLAPNDDAPKVKALFDTYLSTRSMRQAAIAAGLNYNAVRVMLKNKTYVDVGIIDRHTFDRVQILREQRGTRYPKTGKVYLFSGLVRCQHCGSRMGGHTLRNGRIYYRCPTADNSRLCDNSSYVREDRIERFVLDHISEEVGRITLSEKKRKPMDTAPILKKMDKLTDLYLNDLITKAKYELEYKALQTKLNAVQAIKRPTDTRVITSVINVYQTLSQDAKRTFWSRAIDSVECADGEPIRFTLSV